MFLMLLTTRVFFRSITFQMITGPNHFIGPYLLHDVLCKPRFPSFAIHFLFTIHLPRNCNFLFHTRFVSYMVFSLLLSNRLLWIDLMEVSLFVIVV